MGKINFDRLPTRPLMTDEQIAAEDAAKEQENRRWQTGTKIFLFAIVGGTLIGVIVEGFLPFLGK